MRVGVLLVVWLVGCCSCAAAVSLPRGPSRVTRQRITATAEAVGGMHGQSMPVPQRVVPIPAVTISHQGARRASDMAIASDLPAGGLHSTDHCYRLEGVLWLFCSACYPRATIPFFNTCSLRSGIIDRCLMTARGCQGMNRLYCKCFIVWPRLTLG